MPGIYETFAESAKRHAGRIAITYLDEGRQVPWTYRDLLEKVDICAAALREIGCKQGDRVALVSNNHQGWAIVDLALNKLGVVLVPVHTVLTAEQISKILSQSKAKMLIIGPGIEDKLQALIGKLPENVASLLFIEKATWSKKAPAGKSLYFLPDLMKTGEKLPPFKAP